MQYKLILIAAAAAAFAAQSASAWTYTAGSPATITDGDWTLNVTLSGNNVTLTAFSVAGSVAGFNGDLDLSVPIGDGTMRITSIPNNAFSAMPAYMGNPELITSVKFPETLTSIGQDAFFTNKALKAVSFPTSLTSIGNAAFRYSGLEKVVLPPNVKTTTDSTFRDNKSLGEVVLHENFTQFGAHSFRGCTSLTNITPFLPSSLINTGNNTFDASSALTGHLVLSNPNLTTVATSAFYGTAITSLDMSESGIKIIGDSAFRYCASLESVVFPKKLEQVYGHAFNNNPLLKNFTPFMPNTLTNIGNYAFANCKSEDALVLGSQDRIRIDRSAFISSSITSIEFGEGIWNLNATELFSSSLSVTQVVFRGDVPIFGSDAFHSWDSMQAIVYAPRGNESWEDFVAKGGTPPSANWHPYSSFSPAEITAFETRHPGAKKPDGKIKLPRSQNAETYQAFKWFKVPGPPETVIIVR